MKISIITPNYNYGHYISELLTSIKNQSYQNWEHIIVDDGSTDNSREIIKSFSDTDNRIELFTQINSGQTNALNFALKKISGDILYWINSDDYLYNNTVFEKVVKNFTNSNFDIIYGDSMILYEDIKKIVRRKQLAYDEKMFIYTNFCNCVMSNTVFLKLIIKADLIFDESYNYNMDSDFFINAFKNKNVHHTNSVFSVYRSHSLTKTKELSDKYYKELDSVIFKYTKTTEKTLNYKRSFYKLKRILLRLLYGHYFSKSVAYSNSTAE